MKKVRKILDTNILVRFLTDENSRQADAVEQLFQKSEDKSLLLPDAVIIETVYVLLSYYELSKEDVIKKLTTILDFPKFSLKRKRMRKALALYDEYTISFVDAYLAALSTEKSDIILYTFDKKLTSIKEIHAVAPTSKTVN